MATHVTNQLEPGRPVRRSQHRGPRSVVAGGLTGGINILIIFPTEFIKTQLQLDRGRTVMSAHHSRLSAGNLSPIATVLSSCKEKIYTGSVDVVKKTVRERGLGGLYSGVQVLLTGTIPTYAVRFGVFDSLKSELTGPEGQLSPASRMLCGLCAGVAEATLVVTWIETLKVRLIYDQRRRTPRFRGLVDAATTIVREEVRSGRVRQSGALQTAEWSTADCRLQRSEIQMEGSWC